MEISDHTKQYLSQIAERCSAYYSALEYTKDYVISSEDIRNETILDCMLMSILWVAANRNEKLTEEDVCMFLNVDVEVDAGDITVAMVPEMQDWTLDEVLNYVNGTCGTV